MHRESKNGTKNNGGIHPESGQDEDIDSRERTVLFERRQRSEDNTEEEILVIQRNLEYVETRLRKQWPG